MVQLLPAAADCLLVRTTTAAAAADAPAVTAMIFCVQLLPAAVNCWVA
jgi:hypothetical protein